MSPSPSAGPESPRPKEVQERPAGVRGRSANPGQSVNPGTVDYPWRCTCPMALRPWLDPDHPHPDPWNLARSAGLLEADPGLASWASNPELRNQAAPLAQVREALRNHAERRLGLAWSTWSSAIRTMQGPNIPPSVLRILPPQTAQILEEAWEAYLRDTLQRSWDQVPENPDPRIKVLVPPFPSPDPLPIPDLEVAQDPSLWLAWSSPEPNRLEPLLLRADRAPMALETMELRHEGTDLLCVVTTVGTALSLEHPSTEPIVRALCNLGGLWVDETAPQG